MGDTFRVLECGHMEDQKEDEMITLRWISEDCVGVMERGCEVPESCFISDLQLIRRVFAEGRK